MKQGAIQPGLQAHMLSSRVQLSTECTSLMSDKHQIQVFTPNSASFFITNKVMITYMQKENTLCERKTHGRESRLYCGKILTRPLRPRRPPTMVEYNNNKTM
ncbi:hypothetical protein ILYODFUR_038082 [Ilyodon furcidens]|uniref:Uncharacterized protein n=1 Tax=Ilyodon furcidens TaxID=33524 RepID=A0ABV0T7B6_9TELE